MANLDDFSLAIGKLNARYEEGGRRFAEILRRLDSLAAEQNEMRMDLQKLISKQQDLEERLADAEETIKDYKRLKQRGLGVVAFVGFIAAGGATVISKWLNL